MLVSPRDQRNITFNLLKQKYTKLKFDCNVQHLKYIQGSETLLIFNDNDNRCVCSFHGFVEV